MTDTTMKILFPILLLLLLLGCTPEEKHNSYKIELPVTSLGKQASLQSLEKRLSSIAKGQSEFSVDSINHRVTAYVKTDLNAQELKELIIHPGHFQISRMLNALPAREKIAHNTLLNKILEHPRTQLHLKNPNVVCRTNSTDTSIVAPYLRHLIKDSLKLKDASVVMEEVRDESNYAFIDYSIQINENPFPNIINSYLDDVIYAEQKQEQILTQKKYTLQFNPTFQKLWEDFTRKNVGSTLKLYLDSSLLSSPVIPQPVTTGKIGLTHFPFSEEAYTTPFANGAKLVKGILKYPHELVVDKAKIEVTLLEKY